MSDGARDDGHWAVVLGASCGTGGAIARAVARSPGLNVFGVHRGNHPVDAAEVEREVKARGRRAHFRVGEGGTAAAVAAGADELLEVCGPRSVKLLVHSLANASVGPLTDVHGGEPLQPRHFEKTFESMAHSFVYWAQALMARDLLAPEAHLLGLSNTMVDQVMRGAALIAATKAALEIYVRHLARELGPRGHRVNLLKFAAVLTPAVEKTFRGPEYARLESMLHAAIPLGRICTAEEVATFVALLAGPGAHWFNGATIDYTGAQFQGLFDTFIHPDAPKGKGEK